MSEIGALFMALPALTPLQWFALVHPVLIILFVYPVVGATIRLGILARERRLQINPIAPTVPIEHADHGRWVTGALVLAVLLAFSQEVAAAWIEQPLDPAALPARWLALVAATLGVLAALAALLQGSRTFRRLGWALACWLGLLLLGSQPEVNRLADSPLQALFWQSHFWGGMLLTGCFLLATALQAEIAARPRIRKAHVLLNLLVALLLATQAISGTRTLLLA
jgi:hypothetical protein